MGAAILWPKDLSMCLSRWYPPASLELYATSPVYQRHVIAAFSRGAHTDRRLIGSVLRSVWSTAFRMFYSPSRFALCVHDIPALQLA